MLAVLHVRVGVFCLTGSYRYLPVDGAAAPSTGPSNDYKVADIS